MLKQALEEQHLEVIKKARTVMQRYALFTPLHVLRSIAETHIHLYKHTYIRMYVKTCMHACMHTKKSTF